MKKRILLGAGFILVSLVLAACAGGLISKETAVVMKPAAQPAAKIVSLPKATMIAVGDMNLARRVDWLMRTYGMDYPLKEVKGRLQQADATFGNLECAVSNRGAPLPGKGIWLRAKPEVMTELKECGFDILSVANNHSLDYDTEAFLDTLKYLDQAGIIPVGGGTDIIDARKGRIMEVNGLKIGFLAYTEMADMVWSFQHPRKLKASETLPGVAPYEYESILQDVRSLRDQVDIVILSLHWGTEYAPAPSAQQREHAHGFIDAGADVILGHHPHVVQGVELYNQGLIAYSLGNFVFDQNWSNKTREGLVMELTFKGSEITAAKLLPVIIRESQPRFEQDEWAKQVAGKVQQYSADLETKCRVKEDPLEITIY